MRVILIEESAGTSEREEHAAFFGTEEDARQNVDCSNDYRGVAVIVYACEFGSAKERYEIYRVEA